MSGDDRRHRHRPRRRTSPANPSSFPRRWRPGVRARSRSTPRILFACWRRRSACARAPCHSLLCSPARTVAQVVVSAPLFVSVAPVTLRMLARILHQTDVPSAIAPQRRLPPRRGFRSHQERARCPMDCIFGAPLPWDRTRHSTESQLPASPHARGGATGRTSSVHLPSGRTETLETGRGTRPCCCDLSGVSPWPCARGARLMLQSRYLCSRLELDGNDVHQAFSGDLGHKDPSLILFRR